MFVERLINQGNAPIVERMMRFTQKRHELIADNIANVSTPGFKQKDLNESAFQAQLRDRIAMRKHAGPGMVRFDDIEPNPMEPDLLTFHDRGNRSIEQLMSDMASNGLKHNMYAELLRKQFDSFRNVLKERVT